jgi:hypothetical protein
MRAFAAFQVTLRHFTVWRAALLALTACVALTLLAWVVRHPQAQDWRWLSVAALICGGAVWLAVSLWRVVPVSLRWDGAVWHLGPAGSVEHEPQAGDLTVCIDLGRWMLLRFAPDRWPARAIWLPAQDSGLEAEWHLLRCAVYSPRPQASASAGHDQIRSA